MGLRWTSRESDPAPRPREECVSGKLGWFSEADAWGAIRAARRLHPGSERHPRGVYRCETCPSYHVTGQMKSAISRV